MGKEGENWGKWRKLCPARLARAQRANVLSEAGVAAFVPNRGRSGKVMSIGRSIVTPMP